jgi:formylglycine-generating enzyme required for sulfatase activity
MQLVELTSGEFPMGARYSDSTSPLGHQVRISHPFLIATTEVTNAQWKQVMGDVPSDFKDDDLPVDHVSWADAREFCQRLSDFPEEMSARRVYRLPTEAEWEFAARGGLTGQCFLLGYSVNNILRSVIRELKKRPIKKLDANSHMDYLRGLP